MSSTPRIPKTQITGLHGYALKRFTRKLLGDVPMAVAAQVGCSWCLDFGYFHAHNEGLDETQGQRGSPVARVAGVHAARA